MGFSVPTDSTGLADSSLELLSSNENKSAQVAEATDERGDYISRNIYGQTSAPTTEFTVKAAVSKAISLGALTTIDTSKYILKSISIKTAPGSAPTVSAVSEQIQDAGTVSSTVSLGTITLSPRHKAQIVAGAFTLSGDGCKLNSCDATFEANITRATKEGATLSHDVQGGKATVNVTVVQTGATAPTITPADNWDMTAPVTTSSPDSAYQTVTCTLTKSFASTEPV